MKNRIKAGDEVVLLSGDDRGSRGKVLQVLPKRGRILVEGVNKIKRHEKKSSDRNNPEGGIMEREASISISKVMLADRYEKRAAKKKAEKASQA